MTSRDLLAYALLVVAAPGLAKTAPTRTPDHHPHPVARSIHKRHTKKPAMPRLEATSPAAAFFYAEGQIYRFSTAPERVTDLVLQPGEVLVSVASGDTARWVIGDTTSGSGAEKRVHVLVKPSAPGLATNIVITTDRRTYHIALTSTAAAGISVASWMYPQDSLLAVKRTPVVVADEAVTAPFAPDQLNFDYSISGALPPWRPIRVFDDGRQTFIEFPASLAVGEAPPLFAVGDKGEAQLVNYRVHGRFYVVDRLFTAAELRLGAKKQLAVRITRTSPVATKARGGE